MILGIISIGLWIATIVGYIIWNLNQKVVKLEQIAAKQKIIIDSVAAIVEESNKQLHQVDLTEAFKADDQIGFFFRNLQNIQDSLSHYLKINYFTQETENAIIEYLKLRSPKKRNKVFNEKINYAFHKLAENIIHTFKFYYTEVDTIPELQHEVVAFLLEKLHLYDQSKGKAYSYFGTIAKRYLILYNNANYKKLKDKAPVDAVDEDKSILIDLVNISEAAHDIEPVSFLKQFTKYVDHNIFTLFPKQRDAQIADAIVELFRKSENIDVFNKKALYIYIKEMTEASTPQITKIIKRLKVIYIRKYNEFYKHGRITMAL